LPGAAQQCRATHCGNARQRLGSLKPFLRRPRSTATAPATDEGAEDTNLEDLAHDQIAQLISARFKGHGLTRLVEAILKAQGYTTYRSPEGADGGADILAGAGPLGFGAPRLCVEVKSESSPIDRPTVDKLLGAVIQVWCGRGLVCLMERIQEQCSKGTCRQFF
jgi:restriction system protein